MVAVVELEEVELEDVELPHADATNPADKNNPASASGFFGDMPFPFIFGTGILLRSLTHATRNVVLSLRHLWISEDIFGLP